MDVINLCTAHGESFLSDTTSYDMLFYEIIRASNDFNTLASYGMYDLQYFERVVE